MAQGNVPPTDSSQKRRTFANIPVLIFSGLVTGIVVSALWISISSIYEKIRIVQGLEKIITIVDLARNAAKTDINFMAGDRKDLLAALENSRRIKTDNVVDGIKTITNPWGNVMVAIKNTDGNIRVETIVPPHICQRFIGSFAQNPQDYGIRRVEVKGWNNAWRQVYETDPKENRAGASSINEATITAACADTVQANVALSFAIK